MDETNEQEDYRLYLPEAVTVLYVICNELEEPFEISCGMDCP